MGFLDHSTNNIIVDAVLTEKGRKALANGTFNIDMFSLSDDEVDYTIVQKFGRTVGKEKIIKNTPIFEAHTNSDLAQKHRLMTVKDATILYMPTVELSGDITAGVVTFDSTTSGNAQSKSITIKQVIQGVSNPSAAFPADQNFYVYVPRKFLALGGSSGTPVDTHPSLDMYTVASSASDSTLKQASITLKPRGLDDTIFNTFGTNSAKNRIDCVVQVVGGSTGIRTTIEVVLNK